MLIALVGPNAVGKTYFVRHAMDALADATPYDFHVVHADNTSDYHLHGNEWLLTKNKSMWQGSKATKVDQMLHMIQNKDEMWLVESARYIIGMNDIIIPEYYRHGGGFRLMIVSCTATVLKKFLIDRNNNNNNSNHIFNEAYWTDKQLLYDCVRNDNMFANHYRPAGVLGRSVLVSYSRAEFDGITLPIMEKWVADPVGNWYSKY
jgi:hypothetical protein